MGKSHNLADLLSASGQIGSEDIEVGAAVSNTYLQAEGYLTTETGDVSNTYLQTQLASSDYQAGEVIEDHFVPADGRQITTISGTANTEAVTSTQIISNTQTKITGTETTGYVVPSGTKYVTYGWYCQNGGGDGTANGQEYLYYKINGGAWNLAAWYGVYDVDNFEHRMEFVFEVGAASANVVLGQMTETTPTLDFKLECRARQSSQRVGFHPVHGSQPWGTPPTSGLSTFHMPYIRLKAVAG